jgi:hypothetical protein
MVMLPKPSDGSSNQGRARRLSDGSHRSSSKKAIVKAKLPGQDSAFDRKLLLSVSKLHLSLALAPVATIQNIFEPCYHEGNEGGIDIDQSLHSATRQRRQLPARLWLAMAFALVVLLPRMYAELGVDESHCFKVSSNMTGATGAYDDESECAGIEAMLRSPFAMMIAPTFILMAVGMFELIDTVLFKFDASGDGALRRFLRAPLHMLFFGWIRSKTPTLQFNDFYLFMGIPNHAVRLTISLSYIFLMCELTCLALLNRIHIGTGLVVSYALGELFCKMLDYMLSPPQCVITMVKSKLLSYGPTDLWLRLFETNDVSFGMTTAEASFVLELVDHAIDMGTLSASVPRRITQIFLSDVNWFIDWDNFTDNPDESASDSGNELSPMFMSCGGDNDIEANPRRRGIVAKCERPEGLVDLVCAAPTPSRNERGGNATPSGKLPPQTQAHEEAGNVALPPTCTTTTFVGGRRPMFQEW